MLTDRSLLKTINISGSMISIFLSIREVPVFTPLCWKLLRLSVWTSFGLRSLFLSLCAGLSSCLCRTASFSRAGCKFAWKLERRHFVEAEPYAQWKRASPCCYMKTLSGNLCPLAQTVIHERLILWDHPPASHFVPSSEQKCELTAEVVVTCAAAGKQINTGSLCSVWSLLSVVTCLCFLI